MLTSDPNAGPTNAQGVTVVAAEYERVISADSHVIENSDLWEKALGDRYGDEIPHHMSEWKGKKGNYYYSGRQVLTLGEADSEHRDSGFGTAGHEPEVRISFQKEAGVEAEVLYPTFGLAVMQSQHMEALKACAEVYNDWLREFFSHDPARLLGVALIPLMDTEWAVKELERCAKNGFRAAMVNCRGLRERPPYHHKMYDPFWARVAELGFPLTLHSVTGWLPSPFHPQTEEEVPEAPRWVIEQFNEIQGTLGADFIFGCILDRHPSLKIICSEFEMSWMSYFLWRIDMMHGSLSKRVALPKLDLAKPSDYIFRNTWHGWIDDGHGTEAVKVLGTDRVLWGSDFPHVRSPGVNTQSEAAKLLGALSKGDQNKIIAANTAALYNIH